MLAPSPAISYLNFVILQRSFGVVHTGNIFELFFSLRIINGEVMSSILWFHIEGSRPEWCISSMIYSRDTPFCSETLDMWLCEVMKEEAEVLTTECFRL